MATFIERVIAVGDYAEDGGAIDPVLVHCLLSLYSNGSITSTYIKGVLSLTSTQGDQLDDVLSTMPNSGAAAQRAQWATLIYSYLMLGRQQVVEYDTDSELAAAIGI